VIRLITINCRIIKKNIHIHTHARTHTHTQHTELIDAKVGGAINYSA